MALGAGPALGKGLFRLPRPEGSIDSDFSLVDVQATLPKAARDRKEDETKKVFTPNSAG